MSKRRLHRTRGPNVVSRTCLAQWKVLREQVKSGIGSGARVLFIGDSKTMGAGTGTSPGGSTPLTANAFPNNKFIQVGSGLASVGIPSRTSGWMGTSGLLNIADIKAYNTRLTGASSWLFGSVSLGGACLTASDTTPLILDPSIPINRCSVFHIQQSGDATFSVTKGAESFTINADSTTSLFKRSEIIFTTKDASPISIVRTGVGGNLNLCGMLCWDASAPAVEIINSAIYGIRVAPHADTTFPYSPLNALLTYAPHLTVINIGTNDVTHTVLSTALVSLTAIITAAKLSGEVVLIWPSSPPNSGFGNPSQRLTWESAYRQLALQYDCAFISEDSFMGGNLALFADSIHENIPGLRVEANNLTQLLLAL